MHKILPTLQSETEHLELWHLIQLITRNTAYLLSLVFYFRCLKQQVVIIFILMMIMPAQTPRHASLGCLCPEMLAIQSGEAFGNEWRVAVLLCRHRPFDSGSAFSSAPPLCAVFVWCYFSRKRQTPLSSGSAVLLRAIHACCRAHRVKHNKGRPLFTSGTNHPDGTSINPPPCRQWLECTYVWPRTIQMRQRQIELGCTEAIFSLARWPVACSRLLSPPHLLLTDVPATGWVSQLYLCTQVCPTAGGHSPVLTCPPEDPFPHSSSLLFFPNASLRISSSGKKIGFRLAVWSRHTGACFCSCLI